jgi:hypothetical protein
VTGPIGRGRNGRTFEDLKARIGLAEGWMGRGKTNKTMGAVSRSVENWGGGMEYEGGAMRVPDSV